MAAITSELLSGADIIAGITRETGYQRSGESRRCNAETNGYCQSVRGGIQKRYTDLLIFKLTGVNDEERNGDQYINDMVASMR